MSSDINPRPTSTEMGEYEWGDLLDGIKRQKCLIVIGPEIYTLPGQPSTEKRLAEYLRRQADQLHIRVQDNGWFHLLPGYNEISPLRQVKEFYQQPNEQVENILRKLVRIRVPVVLSLNPDDKLRRAFKGYSVSFENYVRNKPYREDQNLPAADYPVVFNLLGHIEDRNSLVLTYDDFYDYLKSIFTGNSMSPILKDVILKAEQFLFLGIPFDQWYDHLFMRILRQTDENQKVQRFAVPLKSGYLDSCEGQYVIRFVEKDIAAFLDELIQHCEREGESLLRPLPTETGEAAPDDNSHEQFFSLLNELLSERRLQDVYDTVKKVLTNTGEAGRNLLSKFVLLKGRYTDLEEQYSLGLLKRDDYDIEATKLSKSFIDAIDDLRGQWRQLNIQL